MTDFVEAIQTFKTATLNLYDALVEYRDSEPDLEEATRQLFELNDARVDLKGIHGELEALVVRLFGNRKELLIDGRQVEKMTGSSRKTWQHAQIGATVLQRLRDLSLDEETGEYTMTAEDALQAVLRFGHIDYWRVKELKELDINADLYCEATEGDPKIVVRKAK